MDKFFQGTSKITSPNTAQVEAINGNVGGDDIFNVNFQTSDGTAGLNINLQDPNNPFNKFARLAIPDKSKDIDQRYLMDQVQNIVNAGIDFAAGAENGIPVVGSISGTTAAAAHLITNEVFLNANYAIDKTKNQQAQKDLNNFLNDPKNNNFGTVNIRETRSVVEIHNFEIGKDIILLPKLPTNWTYTFSGVGTYADGSSQNYVTLKYSNGSNGATEFLHIGIEASILSQISQNSLLDLFSNLLVQRADGAWEIGKKNKTPATINGSSFNGTPAEDYIDASGSNFAANIQGGAGNDTIIGTGNLNDTIDGGTGDDLILVGTGNDTIFGGTGKDTVSFGKFTTGINLSVNTNAVVGPNGMTGTIFKVNNSFDTLYSVENIAGTNSNDVINLSGLTTPNDNNAPSMLSGGQGSDTIIGSQFNDVINPGYDINSKDIVDGGDGFDILTVDYGGQSNSAGVQLGGNGTNNIYDLANTTTPLVTVSNIERFNITGTQYDDAFLGNSTSDYFINGGAGNDTIKGSTSSDNLIGGEGNDLINPGAFQVGSVDTVSGGDGIDTLQADYTSKTNSAGIDIGFSSNSSIYDRTNGAAIVNYDTIENLNVTGTQYADVLRGGTGNDILNGAAGDDILAPGAFQVGSVNTLSGGDGNDTLQADYTSKMDRVGIDLESSTISALDGKNTIIVNYDSIENLNVTGTQYDDILKGGSGNDTLIGGSGNDTLIGGSGNDTLIGGEGNDLINPGAYQAGSLDIVYGSTGNNTLQADYTSKTNGAGIDLGYNGYAGSNAIYDRLTGNAIVQYESIQNFNITGTQYNDVLRGGTGNNILNGGAGNDLIYGGSGNNTLIGGAGSDLLSGGTGDDILDPGYNLGSFDRVYGGAGNNTLQVDYTAKTNGAGVDIGYNGTNTIYDRLTGDALVQYDSIQNFNITGSSYDDVLRGGTGNNILNGGAGNDTLIGGTGNNTLLGGTGNDILNGGAGDDILDPGYNLGSFDKVSGGGGNNTLQVDYTSKTNGGGVDVGYTANNAIYDRFTGAVLVQYDSIQNFNITGSQYDDVLRGGTGSNILNGGAGNDVLIGGSGKNTLIGGTGNDTLYGGTGDDILDPGYNLGSLDRVYGGGGNNTLQADYTGKTDGTGIDVGYNGTNGIYNRNNTATPLVQYDSIQNFSITGSSYDDVLRGGTGSNILNGGAGNDIIYGGAGNNTLYGGTGNDIIYGGAGNNFFDPGYNVGSLDRLFGVGGNNTLQADYTSKTNGGGVDVGYAGYAGSNAIYDRVTGNAIVSYYNIQNFSITGTQYDDVLRGGTGTSALNGGAGNDTFVVNYQAGSFNAVSGGDGNDTLQADYTNKTNGAGIEVGYNGNNAIYDRSNGAVILQYDTIENFSITGTQYNDVLRGSIGNNTLNGGAGNDTLVGGDGSDTLNGGAGNDTLIAGIGTQTLYGGAGNDTLIGSVGNDILNPGYSVGSLDTVYGGGTNNILQVDYSSKTDGGIYLQGNVGQNHIHDNATGKTLVQYSGIQNFNITGSQLSDTLFGGTGNNILNGGAGDDQLWAGNGGNNTLNGGTGDDRLIASTGKDILTGGTGSDRFDYTNLSNSLLNNFDVITDFSTTATENDRFLVSNAVTSFNNVGAFASLDGPGISGQLTTSNFVANSVAQFTLGSGSSTRTFVAINDYVAGFNPLSDAIIEVTGLQGNLGIGNFTT